MSEPVQPPDTTPAAPATSLASTSAEAVAAAEAHLAGLDMARQRAIVKALTR
jgi:hypothetical protein